MTVLDKPRKKRTDLWMTLGLGVAIGAAVIGAIVSSRSTSAAGARAEDTHSALATSQPEAPAAQAAEDPPVADATLTGEVLETLPVSKYTYLRLNTASGEVWAAVPTATVAIGSQIAIANATRMDDFKSSTLKRTFKAIYFGTLGTPSARGAGKFSPLDVPPMDDDSTLPPGHPEIGAAAPAETAAPLGAVDESAPLPPGHPAVEGTSPHGTAQGAAPGAALPVVVVERARGHNARLIAELDAQAVTLAGQRVRVRGQVTKVTPDINGRAFFHVRDGAPGHETDLVVTSLSAPERGQVATFEGIVRTNVDVGIGYKYPVLLEDALIILN